MALYPGYQFLFLFDNATSHAIYAEDALRVVKMNKSTRGQQPFLRDGWFEKDNQRYPQPINFLKQDPLSGQVITTQKRIQMILEERSLWPAEGLNLICPTPGCPACQLMTKCKACIKRSRCASCMEKKNTQQ